MRLINLDTLELEELLDNNLPPYAILSHTWELEEVAYKDWPTQKAGTPLKGYKKILGFRNVARSKYECNYGWVDTCCIDKSSSAELTEAINSMYRWYAKAEVCIAYLADVQGQSDEIPASRWMTRGWTLQELIAPSRVEFYDFAWVYLGLLSGRLAKELEVSSGIPVSVLTKDSPPSDWSVAERMSWASQRQTTRLEDEAYCLLGLFDVSLPLIYGEGERAFVRLQEEIIRSSVDHSIFAWHFRCTLSLQPAESYSSADEFGPLLSRGNAVADAARRILAPSPAYFWDCGDVEECYLDVKGWVESYEMHNLGLGISLPLVPCGSQVGLYHAVLNCRFRHLQRGPIAINLKRTSQTSARLQHGNNVDLETTTFGVVRVNDLESTRFQCGASHLDRLSIAEEEALITTRKARVTILRICSPSITVSGTNSVRKTRLGSMRAPKSLRPFQPSRLKVAMTNGLDSRALRTNAIPQDQWDATSHIWFTKSPVGAISFAWEQDSLELTFVFATGTDRDVPFHMALLETSRAQSVDYANLLWFKRVPALGNEYVLPEDAYERWESRLDISEDSHTDPLRIGQTLTYIFGFVAVGVQVERFESMSKVFHRSTITVSKQQPPFGQDMPQSSQAAVHQSEIEVPRRGSSGPPVGAVQYRAEPKADDEEEQDDKLDGRIPFTIQEEVVNARAESQGDRHTNGATSSLRRQFSFEQ